MIDESTSNLKEREIDIVNSVFAQDWINFDERYESLAKDLYQTELQHVDFEANATGAVNTINRWMYNQSRGYVNDVLSHVTPETILLMVNTLYYKGSWEMPFHKLGTRPKPFYPDGATGNPVEVPMMSKIDCLPYYHWQEKKVHVIGLPYKQNVTMYIFLPENSTRTRIAEVQRELTANVTNEILSRMTTRTVAVMLPKMRVSNSFNMKQTLRMLGLYTIFDRNSANLYHAQFGTFQPADIFTVLQDTKENAIKDLQRTYGDCFLITELENVQRGKCLQSGDRCDYGGGTCVCCSTLLDYRGDFHRRRRRQASQRKRNIYLGEMLHKVDMTVNEKGTEGNVLIAALIDRLSPSQRLVIDRPFMFILREESTRLPLLYGSIFSPL